MRHAPGAGCRAAFDARVKFACLAAYFVAALHARTPVAIGACAAAAVAMAVATRLSPRAVAGAVRPLAAILAFTAAMQVLYIQQGAVLVRIGPVAVTQGALEAAATMVAGLACVMVASVAFMRSTPPDQLVSVFDWLLGPLRALGARTGAFVLALTVALRFVPVFTDDLDQLRRSQACRLASFDGKPRGRLAAYVRLFPPLVRSSFRRADRLADAFAARCFTGAARAGLHPRRVRLRDIALLSTSAVFVAVTFLL